MERRDFQMKRDQQTRATRLFHHALRGKGALLALAAALASPGAPALLGQEKKASPPPESLAWISELTRLPPGPHRVRPLEVEYGLSWNKALNAGQITVRVENIPEDGGAAWMGRAAGRSNGLARALWPYDMEAESRIDRETLRPLIFELAEMERDKSYRYRLEFEPTRVKSRTLITPKPDKSGETAPEEKERTYRFEAVQDLLSAALYLRSLELEDGSVYKMLVSPFDRPYHAEFEVLGREQRKVKRETHETVRMSVNIRKVNSDRTLQEYEKMRTATLWVSDDEFRLPVELQADVFVGYVSARMQRREWLAPDPASPAPPPAAAPAPAGEKRGRGLFRQRNTP